LLELFFFKLIRLVLLAAAIISSSFLRAAYDKFHFRWRR
jgi:hypothetical protein